MSEFVRVPFTKAMKKTHTILLPKMLEYHSTFLQAAFQGSGYRFAVMQGSSHLKEKSLRHINHDYCYPGILIIGQILEELDGGRYPADQIAFMEPQAGGACRAGNYYHVIMKVLKKCGHEDIPVISLNYKGKEKHPGFRISPRLFRNAVTAICYGDLVMSLYHQVKPYECVAGDTDAVRSRLEDELSEEIRTHSPMAGGRRAAYRKIIDAFARIPVREIVRKKVCVAGEIYIKFSPLGNHHLEEYLEKQGCQCVMGGFINYAIYVLDSDFRAYMADTPRPIFRKFYEMGLAYLKKIQRELYEEVERQGRFEIDMPFAWMKERTLNAIGCDCITGDGWLVAAEVCAAVERGCKHVLIVHPFGCLVSHISERGIVKKLKSMYPDVNIQTVEYDYDSSDTLRESRILLGIADLRGRLGRNQ